MTVRHRGLSSPSLCRTNASAERQRRYETKTTSDRENGLSNSCLSASQAASRNNRIWDFGTGLFSLVGADWVAPDVTLRLVYYYALPLLSLMMIFGIKNEEAL